MYHQMDNEIALELIKEWVKPGYPPLGMQFAWQQPEETDYITVGDLYTVFNGDYTIQDLLFTNKGYYYSPILELAVKLETAKEVIRLARELEIKDLRNDKLQFDGIYCSENPAIELCELDQNEIALYRLAILCLNTMTEGHNLAIEYLEYIAEHYVEKGSIIWGLYDGDNQYLGEIVELITSDDHFPFSFYDNHPHFDVERTLNPDPEVLDWIIGIEEDYQENYTRDLIIEIFPDYDITWDYERGEILYWIAWIIGWLKEEFHSGNLTFSDNPEGLSPKLTSWIVYINSQLELDL